MVKLSKISLPELVRMGVARSSTRSIQAVCAREERDRGGYPPSSLQVGYVVDNELPRPKQHESPHNRK